MDNFDSAAGFVGQQRIDLADVEMLPVHPPGDKPSAFTQGEILVHAMAEARQGALGDEYEDAHLAAINAQNVYRDERGQAGHRRPPPDDGGYNSVGHWDMTYDNQYSEVWVISAPNTIGRVNRF